MFCTNDVKQGNGYDDGQYEKARSDDAEDQDRVYWCQENVSIGMGYDSRVLAIWTEVKGSQTVVCMTARLYWTEIYHL